jgi:hypothetical protein
MARATECTYCRRGPQGIEGHHALFLMDIERGPDYDVGTPLFRCSICEHLWERVYRGEGAFRWRRLPNTISATHEIQRSPKPPTQHAR